MPPFVRNFRAMRFLDDSAQFSARGDASVDARPKSDDPGSAPLNEQWDIVVIGGSNAALAARGYTRRILVLERAPQVFRGGNTRHTRNTRCVHSWSDRFSAGQYPYEELWDDLSKVGTWTTSNGPKT